MENDLISIVIPVYNAEKYLNDTLKTIQNQTYDNWEAIFVDDCSTDNSLSVLKSFSASDSRIKYFKMNHNRWNPCYPRNFGIDKSKGRYLCFIDADDQWDYNKLEVQMKYMKEKDIAFSYHSYEFANEECIPMGKKVIAKETLTYHQCLKNNIISTITVMFDLKKMDKELIKMPDLKYVEDTATWWKILRNGFIAYGIPKVFSYYRQVEKSNSSNKLKTLKYLWKVYREEEHLNVLLASYYFFMKNMHALLRRIK